MKPRLLLFAASILNAASRQHPADRVLRERLKNEPDLSRQESTLVSRAVFSYYRWFKWLDQNSSLPSRVEQAIKLAEAFANDPASFSDSDLVTNAVPDWVRREISVTPEWARALQTDPKLWLRARTGQGRVVCQRLGACRSFGRGSVSDIFEYQCNRDLFRTEEFQRGEFELQDINSQAVGLVCSPEPGSTWFDACAGEGGKTLHLSDLM